MQNLSWNSNSTGSYFASDINLISMKIDDWIDFKRSPYHLSLSKTSVASEISSKLSRKSSWKLTFGAKNLLPWTNSWLSKKWNIISYNSYIKQKKHWKINFVDKNVCSSEILGSHHDGGFQLSSAKFQRC